MEGAQDRWVFLGGEHEIPGERAAQRLLAWTKALGWSVFDLHENGAVEFPPTLQCLCIGASSCKACREPLPSTPDGCLAVQVLPEIVLTLSMILLLLATADRTLRKGVKAFKKESNLSKVPAHIAAAAWSVFFARDARGFVLEIH